MIGFASIAGGAPSSVGAMTDHLLNNTVSPEEAKLAAYYSRGMVQNLEMVDLAEQVACGEIAFSEGVSALIADYIRDGGDIDLLDAAEARLEKRLADLVFRIQEGLQDAPLAVIRPDIHPSAASGLGIDPHGMLSRDEINALLAGRAASGEKIEGKHYAAERRLPVDPKTGELRHSAPIGSYDFCPTPDKSVSVAWAFAGPVERAQIYAAHIEAAREAVAYIAAEIGKVRLGKGGQSGTEAGHVAWLEFTHHTSRRTQFAVEDGAIKISANAEAPGDPDLHTHFLMPNAVFSDSGKVGSLDTAAIGGFIFEADAFYHARLGQKLRDAGFQVALDRDTGAARMPVIPDEVRTLFSKRTNAGEMLAKQEAAERGETWDELSPAQRTKRVKMATQSPTQKEKGGKDDVANVADWRRQAKEVAGWEPGSLQLYGPPAPEVTHEQRIRQAYEVALPFLAEKLEHKAVVTHWDVRVAAARGLVQAGITGLGDIDAVTAIMRKEGVIQYGEKTALVWGVEHGKRYTSVTTALHENDERDFVRLAQKASADRSGAIPGTLLERKITESGLDFAGQHGMAQRAAIQRLGQGGRFTLAVGAAGAGKTAMLKPLVAGWREQGRPVWGASIAWRQADDLAEAGIDPRNVKAFSVLIDGVRDGSIELGPKSVVAVDEWGLLGTRQALELLRLQDRHGFSIVALGDDKQCSAVQAGAIIDLSRRALGAEQVPEILTTLRQQTEREREIVGLFREGRAAEALTMKRSDGTAEMTPGAYNEVVTRVATLYVERLKATGEAPTISAQTNSDAHKIGEAVRIKRRELGLVGDDIRTVKATDGKRNYNLALAAGDRVRLFKSVGADFGDKIGGNIGRNGSVLEVVDVTDRGLSLRAKSGKVGTVAWADLAHRGRVHLAYGDVMTIHTAQGSTAKEHIFALPAGSNAVDGNLGYTANTRHRHNSYIVTSESAERTDVRKRRSLNDARDITTEDKWANVARAFSYQPTKDTAFGLSDRVGHLRRGTVGEFHKALGPAAAETSRQKPPSMAHEVAAERKVARDIAKDLQYIARYAIDQARDLHQRIVGRVKHMQIDRNDTHVQRQDQTHTEGHTLRP
jgi:conjugative relaxase-like TrwC/TraI family protein